MPPVNDPNLPENENTPIPGTTPPVTEPAKMTDWEAAYKGLQRELQKLQGTSTTAVTQLQGRVKELEAQIVSKDAEILKLQGEAATKDNFNKKLTGDLETEKATTAKLLSQTKRTKLILKEFPELAPFEASDILPSAESEEELKTKLKGFREVYRAQIAAAKVGEVAGTPPNILKTEVEPSSIDNEDLLWDKVTSLAGMPGKEKEYEDYYKRWMELQKRKENLKK